MYILKEMNICQIIAGWFRQSPVEEDEFETEWGQYVYVD